MVEKKRINEVVACGEKRAAEGGILEEIQMQRKRIKINNNVGGAAAAAAVKNAGSPFKFLTEKVKVKGFVRPREIGVQEQNQAKLAAFLHIVSQTEELFTSSVKTL